MIHDAQIEVTCDGNGCRESVTVQLPFVYGGIMHTEGHYDHDEQTVEKLIQRDDEWLGRDGKHYCCHNCVPDHA